MAYKQEPCPLCGRDMTAIETYPGRGELYCGHCDLTIGGNDAKTPEELIALMDGSEHRQFKAENAKLQAENAELREELAKARDPQRIGGQADPSSFVYAIEQLREFRWQHATNDEDAIPYINNVAAAHERENAKLRDRITTQKQTVQAYRDESREWREVAERAQAENAKLQAENAKLRLADDGKEQ